MSTEYILTRTPPGNGASTPQQQYRMDGGMLRIGRSTECEVCITDDKGVSRKHALLTQGSGGIWYISDSGSTNGTFVNGTQISAMTALHAGDRIQLGPNGASFTFGERVRPAGASDRPRTQDPQRTPDPQRAARPGGQVAQPQGSIHLSDVLPFLTKDKSISTKSPYFWGGIITVLCALCLFWISDAQQQALQLATTGGNPLNPLGMEDRIAEFNLSVQYSYWFDNLVGIYLCLAMFIAVYVIIGRKKPWWVLAGAGAVTATVMVTPVFSVLHAIFTLPTGEVDLDHTPFSPLLVIRTIISVGLTEELAKALVVFLLVWVGMKAVSPFWKSAGVYDAADAIVIATASATAFTMIETLTIYTHLAFCQYAGDYCQSGSTADITGIGFAETAALQLLIPRIIGDISGHIAYSGYFAYMIGLALQRRAHFWPLILGGWLGASVMHGFWDATSSLGNVVQAIIGVGSFVVFITALRRARRVSGLSQPRMAGP